MSNQVAKLIYETKRGTYLSDNATFAAATAEALAKLLIEKGLITEAEFMQKLSVERAVYQGMLGKVR